MAATRLENPIVPPFDLVMWVYLLYIKGGGEGRNEKEFN